jgi:L-ascorbate metabolism protein UlaG (beta-lactamase superfamily)
MSRATITHIGGPTVLIEVGGWRILTDPTFDPPGEHWNFGWGATSRKLAGPAIAPTDIGPIDIVLLSHDHHGDNLDHAGREMLSRAGTVVTTIPGKRRLGHARTTRQQTDRRRGDRFRPPLEGAGERGAVDLR